MSVAPQMTSTSPVSSAPATSLLAEGVDGAAPDQRPGAGQAVEHRPDRRDAGHHRGRAADDGPRRGREACVPAARSRTAGAAVIAVVESMAPCPVSAWLATAWAGQ